MRTATRALALAGLVVALDQASKALVSADISRGEEVEVLPFLSFTNVHNRGIAFGRFAGASPVLISITIVALIAVLTYMATTVRGPRVWIAAGLLVGGALGNLADRVRIGSVIDFIDLPAWPTFNIADVAIVAGIVCLVLLPETDDGPARE